MIGQSDGDRAPLRILFVCFGNICRSPMAEGLARDLATRQYPDNASLLQFSSAGVGAQNGNPPTEEAVLAMAERGIDIASHRARRATPDVVGACDLVLTMEERQRLWLLESRAETPALVHLKLSEAARESLKEGTAQREPLESASSAWCSLTRRSIGKASGPCPITSTMSPILSACPWTDISLWRPASR